MIERRKDKADKFVDHESRIIELEAVVQSLQWHHRNDKIQEQITTLARQLTKEIETVKITAGEHDQKALEQIGKLALDITAINAKYHPVSRANGNVEARLRWVERIGWGALGAVAAFEFFTRVL